MTKRTPELRFKGFVDDWEQRKLGDVTAEVFQGINTAGDKVEYSDTGTPILQAKHITGGDVTFDEARFLDKERYSNYFLKYVPVENDILFANIGTIGPSTVVRDESEFLVAWNILKITLKKPETAEFIQLQLDQLNQKHYFDSVLTGNATKFVNKDEMLRTPISVPTIEEQKKVGAFFSNIQRAITLHQRKLDLLKQLKQGYLQKMFPATGESIPKVRFADFDDDWEQRKLGDVTKRVRGNDGRMDLPTLTISAGSGWLDQRERFSGNIAGKEQKNYTLLRKGELSYNHGNSKLAKYGAVFELRTYEEALVPRVYHSFKIKKEAVADFIEYLFATKRPDRELGKLISSGARMDGLLNINFDEFMGIKISLPTVVEQEAISEFLRALDNTITLHQNKLKSLKEIKKNFLNKMFV